MAFTQKFLSATITLANGSFAGTNNQNQVTLSGYRMSAHISNAGGLAQIELQLRIYGLGLSLMNQLSTLGKTPVVIDGRNTISISAWEGTANPTVIYVGTIQMAYTDLSGAPQAIFHVSAFSGMGQAMQIIDASSFPGAVDAADIMSNLAGQMGLTLENNGVSVMLHNRYYPGSALTQMQAVAKEARINAQIDGNILAIWPTGGSRSGSAFVISPQTNLIGYPYPSGQGMLALKCLFDPQIKFGRQIQVENSLITTANGPWTICHADYELETLVPGGKWEASIEAYPPGYIGVTQS